MFFYLTKCNLSFFLSIPMYFLIDKVVNKEILKADWSIVSEHSVSMLPLSVVQDNWHMVD